MFFAATQQDLLDTNSSLETSVRLAEGGYIAALGVYHELHCLVSHLGSTCARLRPTSQADKQHVQRRIRLFLFSSTFYPNLTEDNIGYLHEHLGTFQLQGSPLAM